MTNELIEGYECDDVAANDHPLIRTFVRRGSGNRVIA